MFEKCEIFKVNSDGFEIRRIAKGTSLEECAQCFGYTLEELPEADRRFLIAMHARGRAEAKVEAVDAFFEKMKATQNGGSLAWQYLAAFADDWPKDGVASAKDGLSFKVILNNE